MELGDKMNTNILRLLSCPECKKELSLKMAFSQTKNQRIKEGLLECKNCHETYPIIDWIPRLVKKEDFSKEENDSLEKMMKNDFSRDPEIIEFKEENLTEKEKLTIIEKLVREKVVIPKNASKKLKQRTENNIEYRIYHADKKDKYYFAFKKYLRKPITVIADIGGGQGGTLSCINKYIKAEIAILIDYDLDSSKIALIRDPNINICRGDINNLPLKNNSVDLLITAATLEHIKNYKMALRNIQRTRKQAFIFYSPNKFSIYDFGHLNAPITILPRKIIPYATFIWQKIIGHKRSLESIKEELKSTFYYSRVSVTRILKQEGKVYNIFLELINESIKSDYSYSMHDLKLFFRKHNNLLNSISKSIVFLGIEPSVYLFWIKN
jgi:uncharacterized protein YbaR (Trm112 family)/ubiquinone/menaquinone biosynthesis C-methylase UbiE